MEVYKMGFHSKLTQANQLTFPGFLTNSNLRRPVQGFRVIVGKRFPPLLGEKEAFIRWKFLLQTN